MTAESRPRRWLPALDYALPALLALAAICLTINHYGLTYDEGWYISRSVRAREWAARLIADPGHALSGEGIRRYWAAQSESGGQVIQEQQPGGVKLVCGLLGYPLGVLCGVAFPERAGTALFLGAGLIALVWLLRDVWGRAAAWFAALALLAMPRVFSDSHLCTLDVPVMGAMLLSVALMFAAVRRGSLVLAALSGLAWGLALSCKINALFVPLILGPWILIAHRSFAWRAALCLLLGGPVGFVLTWPWLWHDLPSRLAEYLAFHLQHYPVAVSYFGVVSAHQPWHYPPVMAAITTPPLTLAVALVGLGALVWRLKRPAEAPDGPDWRRSQALLLLLGAACTIGFNCLPNAPKYTGTRLFMPFFGFLAALAGVGYALGAEWLTRWVPSSRGTLLTPRRLRLGLAAVLLLPAVRSVALTHPFQMSYYNAFIGGLPGAVARGMEATYWGDSYMAACTQLLPRLQPGDEVWVDLPGCEWIVRQYLAGAPEVRVTSGPRLPPGTTWAIVQNKASERSETSKALMAVGPPAFAVELDGVPLSLVYGREAIRQFGIRQS